MKSTRLLLLLIGLLLLFQVTLSSLDSDNDEDVIDAWSDGSGSSDSDDESDVDVDVDQPPPANYVQDDDDEGEESDDEASEDEEETISRDGSIKTVLQNALSIKNNNTTGTSTNSNAIGSLIQRHHRKIISTSLIVYAFRRELYSAVFYLFSQPCVNVETGQVVRRLAFPSISTIIRISLALHLAWKFWSPLKHHQQQQRNSTDPSSTSVYMVNLDGSSTTDDDDESESEDMSLLSPLISLLWLMGSGGGGITKNPIALILILSRLFFSSKSNRNKNTAYIPPIEQHYTFERLNERHIKDGMALQKAMGGGASSSSSSFSAATLFKATGALNNHTTTAAAQNKPAGPSSWGPKFLSPSTFLQQHHLSSLQHQQHKKPQYNNGTVIVMDITSAHVTQTSILRDQVSFLLSEYRKQALVQTTTAPPPPPVESNASNHTANNATTTSTTSPVLPEMEVVVLLESPGGSASDYALASQQILRLRREPGITVTIAVDKVAASGGYMIACTSSPGRLLAAPFAVLGSIGVVGQTVNVHKVLEGWGVQPLVFRGGRDKAPVGLLGEVTQQGLAKVQDMVDDTHRAFKRFVAESRPAMADRIEQVATGDVWLGYDALKEGLIDRIVTSDEYLGEKMSQGARVLKLVLFKKGKYPFLKPTSSSDPLPASASSVTYGGGRTHSSLKNLGAQLMLQLVSNARNVLERVATSLLDQHQSLSSHFVDHDNDGRGFVDLVHERQPHMVSPTETTTATMASSSSSSISSSSPAQ